LDAFLTTFMMFVQCFFHGFSIEKPGKALAQSALIKLPKCAVKPVIAGNPVLHLFPWQTSSDYGLVNGNYRWQASFRDLLM